MPQLILYPGLPGERVFDLEDGSHMIGRATENGVFVLDKSLSRKHARLDVQGDRVTVVDLKSTNGVFVNGRRVESQPLAHGDSLRCGDVPFLYAADPRIVKEMAAESSRLTMQDLLSEETDEVVTSGVRVPGRDEGERAREKLKILLKVSQILASPEEIDTVLERIVDLLFQIMSVDRAVILLRHEETGAIEPKLVRSRFGTVHVGAGASGDAGVEIALDPNARTGPTPLAHEENAGSAAPPARAEDGATFRVDRAAVQKAAEAEVSGQVYSRAIVNYVLERNVSVLTSDANLDERFGAAESILQQSIRSSMCVPLKPRDRVIGTLYVDNLSAAGGFSEEDLEFLSAFASQAAIAVENARLYRRVQAEAAQRASFLRFFPPTTLKRILTSDGARLGIIETEVTALFSDITGFTSLSSIMKPRDVVDLLNEYFPVMAEIVFRHEGTLEKYIGDALMAVWGAPFQHPDDVDRAVLAAIHMQHALQSFNARFPDRLPLQIHIGLNTGPVAAGNIGSEQYVQYATIGDTTNVASRICNVAQAGEVLMSEGTYLRLKNASIPVEPLPPATVKGKESPVVLYRVDWQTFAVR